MAQITLAQALKEKNRLAGEINRLWGLFQLENSCLATRTRSIDVAKTLQTIEHYTAKLVELKTKIGAANDGNLKNMYLLAEAKNRMAKWMVDPNSLRSMFLNDTTTQKINEI